MQESAGPSEFGMMKAPVPDERIAAKGTRLPLAGLELPARDEIRRVFKAYAAGRVEEQKRTAAH